MHESDRQFDAELRAVEPPAGLLRKLRQTALTDDAGLDEALRLVPLPTGLEARLRAGLLVEDDALDAALCNVSVPSGLATSILRAVTLDDDDALDEALRDVPVPASALRVAASSRFRVFSRRMARWAVAASLFLAVGLAYSGGVIAYLAALRSQPGSLSPDSFITVEPADAEPLVSPESDGSQPGPGVVVELAPNLQPTVPSSLAEPVAPSRSALDEVRDLLAHSTESGIIPFWPQQNVLGFGNIDALPELKKVVLPLPQGMQPPLSPAFSFRDLRETGFFPWTSPAADHRLRTWPVPLTGETESYEMTRRYLEDGELPPLDRVRTEEFLAALDYGFAPPRQGPLRLITAAGPSPFGGEGHSLLQLGVQARAPWLEQHAPTHVVVVLDMSTSMQWGGRIEQARRALGKFFHQIGHADRVSLITFTDKATIWFEDAAIDEAHAMTAMLAGIPVEGATNVAAGLSTAYHVAAQYAAERQTRVVLVSDGAVELDGATSDAIHRRLREAARDSIRLNVIDLNQGDKHDEQLRRFAQAGLGIARRATSVSQVQWALLESLTGAPQQVANDVRLSVTFNPRAVVQYRFFGHEPSAMLRAKGGADLPRVDFHAGQAATGLFELRRLGGDQEVATVELSWTPPTGGARQQIVQKVSTRDFAPTTAHMAPSLQSAALAAQVAEVLREPRANRARPMANLLAVAKAFDETLLYRPSYVELLRLIEQADRAKPPRARR